ncbi:SHOCT domain-containing protein [Natrinema halophilum]|uniref:SHOCT domain-containing protein n=1 Tax=Natrinema halophilum TaxID=1699371 RepID=A0A7D5GPQ9_9EURY|nr:SHOCT domain-containing protein [Natrinema halophilum]QLG50693.1 SHOCT domain-containing protein [Natrinema halophilum]
MALLKNKWLWLAVFGILLSGGLVLVAVGYLGLLVYSGLVSGTPVVEVLLELAVPFLGSLSVLLVVFTLSVSGALWIVVRNASLPQSDRVATLVERLEYEYSPLPPVGLSEFLSPPEPTATERAERALADLKQQYVEGQLTEAEFERKVDRLVANDSIDEARAARERTRLVETDSRKRGG